jgi:predicted phage replisome organizer
MRVDIGWIKISTGIFDDEKIKLIMSLPNGNDVTLHWFRLLVLAGKSNAGGDLLLTKDQPYDEEMLARIWGEDKISVSNALSAFLNLGMISRENGTISLTNWAKYQNIDGMERIRENTRKRVAAYRERRKLLTHVTLPVTLRNALELDSDKDKENIPEPAAPRPPRKETSKKTEVLEGVFLTEEEHAKLKAQFGEAGARDRIENLQHYCLSTGKRYKSHYHTILNWARKDAPKKNPPPARPVCPECGKSVVGGLCDGCGWYRGKEKAE